MATETKKVSELAIAANAANSDRILILRDPSINPSVRTITVANFSANIVLSNTVPAGPTSNGTAGTIRYDSNNVYICIANNTWRRAALTTW